jgi:hypothetical protein
LETFEAKLKKHKAEVSEMSETCSLIQSFIRASEKKKAQSSTPASSATIREKCDAKLVELDQRLQNPIILESLSPDTKEMYKYNLNMQRKELIHQMNSMLVKNHDVAIKKGENSNKYTDINDDSSSSEESDT